MLRKRTPVMINDEKFEIVVNTGAMIDVENLTEESFLNVVKKAEKGSIPALAHLLSACLHKEEKPVGMDYIRDMDVNDFGDLFNPLIDAIIASFPIEKKTRVILPT